MGATGAEGGGALNDLLDHRKSRTAGFGETAEFGGESAVSQLRGDFVDGFDERNDFLREDGVVQPAGVGNSFFAMWEALAAESCGDIRRHAMGKSLEGGIADIFFQEAASLFDHDHGVAE